MRSIAALFLCSLAAASCGRDSNPVDGSGPRKTEIAETPVAEAEVRAEIGPLTATVNDLAFWSHPILAFNSLLIATTDAGVSSFNIEDGSLVARIESVNAANVQVFYSGVGTDAHGIAAIRDVKTRRFRFFEIDNVSREFSELQTLTPQAPGANSFCIGSDRSQNRRLYAFTTNAMLIYDLKIEDDRMALEAVGSAEAPDGVVDCAADDIDGTVFAVTEDGDIYHYAAATGFGTQFVTTASKGVTDIAIALNGLVADGPAEECCGQLAILESATGTVRFYDREDGHVIGAVRIGGSFDFEGVSAATAIGLGYANYGSVYRDGVLALATWDKASAVRLAPYNAVMDALGASLGQSAEPRALFPQEDDDALVIDLAPLKP